MSGKLRRLLYALMLFPASACAQYSLRGVVRDNGAYLRSSMFDLRQASRSFKELAREVRQRPSRLLFSNSPGERKLP